MADLRPVIHLIPAEPFGGLQRIVIELARAQRAAGRAADIVLMEPSPRVEAECRAEGIVPTVLSGPKLRRMWALRRMLQGSGDAILHSHCDPIWSTIIVSSLTSRLRSRWIVHVHVYARQMTRRDRIGHYLYRRGAGRFLAITRSVGDSYLALGIADAERLDVVPNGLRYPPSTPPPRRDGPFVFGFVGRTVRIKGLFDFIAVADLLRADSDIRFLIAGEGEDMAEARLQIETLGLQDRIDILGFVDMMAPVWARTDMLAMLTDREPFGLVILEAITAGVAVLGYDAPSGGREVMASIRGCTMVEPFDLTAVAEAVRAAAWNRAGLRDDLAAGAETVRDLFSIERMERRVAASYARLDTA
ncbi:MAG: glycosyltransferase [Sphingomonas sp.]